MFKKGIAVFGLFIRILVLTKVSLVQAQDSSLWEKAIEREIKKHDQWVTDYIEQDYSNDKREGFVTFQKLSEEFLKQSEELGHLPIAAAYQPVDDILFLPEYKDEEKIKKAFDSIDHELWHAISDKMNKKGLLHQKEYSGPSWEEITAFCQTKVSSQEFAELKEKLMAEQELQFFQMAVVQLSADYLRPFQRIKSQIEWITQYVQEKREKNIVLSEEEAKAINTDWQKVQKRITDFGERLQAISQWMKDILKSLEGKESLTVKEVVEKRETLNQYLEELKVYQGLAEDVNRLKKQVFEAYEQAEDRKLAKEIEELEQKADKAEDPQAKRRLLKLIEYTRTLRELEKAGVSSGDSFSEAMEGLVNSFGGFLGPLVSLDNVYKVHQVLNDPDEVMARAIDSLYSLYYGPVTVNKFPLAENDLKFLERFKHKGENLFKKGIEKYKVGLEMLIDGISPDEVKRQLEYATDFSYKGKKYLWQEPKFKIIGAIPTFSLLEKLKETLKNQGGLVHEIVEL